MPATQITDTYNALLTTTLKNYRKKLAVNIFAHIPLFWWLFTRGRKNPQDGGESIIQPLLYGENDTVSSYDHYDTLDLTPQEGMTVAQFNWKQVAGTVTISLKEERQNSGAHKMINLLKAKVQQIEISFRNRMYTMAHGDGTGNGGKDMLGLKAIIDATPATGTLGGINRATAGNEWWRNINYNSTGGAGGAVGAYITNLRLDMSHTYNLLTEGTEHPDLIIPSMQAYEWFEALLTPNQRYMNPEAAKAGFQTLMFKGATMFFDGGLDAQGDEENMLFINSKYIDVTVDTMIDFFQTPFQEAYNQTAKAAKLLWMGNLTVSNCRKQGFLGGITVS